MDPLALDLAPSILLNVGGSSGNPQLKAHAYFAAQSSGGAESLEYHGRFSPVPLPLGRWTHLALAYDPHSDDPSGGSGGGGGLGRVVAYVDGVAVLQHAPLARHPRAPRKQAAGGAARSGDAGSEAEEGDRGVEWPLGAPSHGAEFLVSVGGGPLAGVAPGMPGVAALGLVSGLRAWSGLALDAAAVRLEMDQTAPPPPPAAWLDLILAGDGERDGKRGGGVGAKGGAKGDGGGEVLGSEAAPAAVACCGQSVPLAAWLAVERAEYRPRPRDHRTAAAQAAGAIAFEGEEPWDHSGGGHLDVTDAVEALLWRTPAADVEGRLDGSGGGGGVVVFADWRPDRSNAASQLNALFGDPFPNLAKELAVRVAWAPTCNTTGVPVTSAEAAGAPAGAWGSEAAGPEAGDGAPPHPLPQSLQSPQSPAPAPPPRVWAGVWGETVHRANLFGLPGGVCPAVWPAAASFQAAMPARRVPYFLLASWSTDPDQRFPLSSPGSPLTPSRALGALEAGAMGRVSASGLGGDAVALAGAGMALIVGPLAHDHLGDLHRTLTAQADADAKADVTADGGARGPRSALSSSSPPLSHAALQLLGRAARARLVDAALASALAWGNATAVLAEGFTWASPARLRAAQRRANAEAANAEAAKANAETEVAVDGDAVEAVETGDARDAAVPLALERAALRTVGASSPLACAAACHRAEPDRAPKRPGSAPAEEAAETARVTGSASVVVEARDEVGATSGLLAGFCVAWSFQERSGQCVLEGLALPRPRSSASRGPGGGRGAKGNGSPSRALRSAVSLGRGGLVAAPGWCAGFRPGLHPGPTAGAAVAAALKLAAAASGVAKRREGKVAQSGATAAPSAAAEAAAEAALARWFFRASLLAAADALPAELAGPAAATADAAEQLRSSGGAVAARFARRVAVEAALEAQAGEAGGAGVALGFSALRGDSPLPLPPPPLHSSNNFASPSTRATAEADLKALLRGGSGGGGGGGGGDGFDANAVWAAALAPPFERPGAGGLAATEFFFSGGGGFGSALDNALKVVQATMEAKKEAKKRAIARGGGGGGQGGSASVSGGGDARPQVPDPPRLTLVEAVLDRRTFLAPGAHLVGQPAARGGGGDGGGDDDEYVFAEVVGINENGGTVVPIPSTTASLKPLTADAGADAAATGAATGAAKRPVGPGCTRAAALEAALLDGAPRADAEKACESSAAYYAAAASWVAAHWGEGKSGNGRRSRSRGDGDGGDGGGGGGGDDGYVGVGAWRSGAACEVTGSLVFGSVEAVRLKDQRFGGQRGEEDEVVEFQKMRALDDDGAHFIGVHRIHHTVFLVRSLAARAS